MVFGGWGVGQRDCPSVIFVFSGLNGFNRFFWAQVLVNTCFGKKLVFGYSSFKRLKDKIS